MGLLRRFGIGVGAVVGAFVVAALALPWWFDRIEVWRGEPLPYEGVLRLTITVAAILLLLLSLLWLLTSGERRHWILWGVLTFSFATLLPVFFLDTGHRLMEEFSWIRYTTAGFLVAAAIVSTLLAYLEARRLSKTFLIFWLIVASALLYAGLDEVLEIHEALGRFIENKLQLPHVTTDLITVGYAVVALVALLFMYRKKVFSIHEITHSFPFLIFVAGGIVYFFSTMFDTLDVVVGRKLWTFANVLSIDPSFVFSDVWAAIWAQKNFFNGLEEVFEHTAATFFFAALLVLSERSRGPTVVRTVTITTLRWWGMFSIITLLVLFIIPSLTLSSSYIFTRSPLVSTNGTFVASRIAGYFDWLFHTDDLFYHPSWGVLVANEGKGNIYQWKNERWGMLPDPKKVLRDTDSITADAKSVYVSDGSQGTIFRSSGRGDWEALWTKKDGLKHPEGIVAVGDVLYVVDESEKSLVKLVQEERPEVWRPKHPDWRAPEGIAYDEKRGVLVVTDDESGAVFAVDFGKSVQPLARLSKLEDVVVAPDGRILVTDNGWGAVFAINRDGAIEKLVQFRRSYRDLQGITIDDVGRIYVVSADGFDSVSFMPSFLFRIE